MTLYFPIEKVPFEGPDCTNVLAYRHYDPDEMYAFEYRPADEHADFVTNAREEVQFHILQLSQKCQLTIYLADILVQH